MFAKHKEFWIGLGLLLLTSALYLPSIGFRFIPSDDTVFVLSNEGVTGGLTLHGVAWAFGSLDISCWQPLVWLSYQLDYSLYGLNAGGYHFTNLLWHSLNTLLVFVLLRKLWASPWPAALIAALFGWHPLHVESVAWVAERKDVLSTFFLLLTLLSYYRYAQRPCRLGLGWTLFWFACGLMSKAVVVVLPLSLLLLDYWPLGRWQGAPPLPGSLALPAQSWRRLLREKVPFGVLGVGSCVVTIFTHYALAEVHEALSIRLFNVPIALLKYLQKGFWPSDLCFYYPLPSRPAFWAGGVAFLVVGALSAAVLWQARRRPWFAVGWGWFLVTLLPVLNIVHVGSHAWADRYSYVSLLGIFVAVVWQTQGWSRRHPFGQRAAVGLSLLLLAACLVASHRQLGYWRNGATSATHALAIDSNNAFAHNVMAVVLESSGRSTESLVHLRECFRLTGLRRDRLNLATELALEGLVEEALPHFTVLQTQWSTNADVYLYWGIALACKHDYVQARSKFEQALFWKPALDLARFNMAQTSIYLGEPDRALQALGQAAAQAPTNAVYKATWAYELAFCPAQAGPAPAQALQVAQQASAQSGQTNAACLRLVALCYAAQNQFAPAVATAQQAQTLASQTGQLLLAQQLEADLLDFGRGRCPAQDWQELPDFSSPPPLAH